ncbi:MAG: DNA-processing protein DprA [Marinirhabdus sp.]|nr:DNA-processing protein DprA [Marinirhabdus sp.]
MLSQNELLYTLALQCAKNLGDSSIKKLLRTVGSAEGVFKEKKEHLLKIDGIGRLKLRGLKLNALLPAAEAELRFIQSNAIGCHYFLDESYPAKLKHCVDGPILLFERGTIDLQHRRIISIVGTRKITNHGKLFCKKLIEDLIPLNPIIVSGFAYGTDITAHTAAMSNDLQTIACLAHGLNQMYPKSHQRYVRDIESNGGFFTEFWSNDPFERTNFLKRNRIIAGLSEATVVIESAEKGGSLVTADIANSYNRDVFAVPGRAEDRQSLGCNNLIKSNRAHLITSAADLVYVLGWDLEPKNTLPVQTKMFAEFSEKEQVVYQFLESSGKKELDQIALSCHMPTHEAVTLLLNLELKGAVRPLPGKVYEAV